MKKVLSLLIIGLLLTSVSLGQIETEFIKLAEKGNFVEAQKLIESSYNTSSDRPKLLYLSGILKILNNSPQEGVEKLKAAKGINPKVGNYEYDYWLGLGFHFTNQYDAAIEVWRKYLSKAPIEYKGHRKFVKALIEESKAGLKFDQEHTLYIVENMGDNINTKFAEHSAYLATSEGSLYYTSTHPKEITDDGFYVGISEDIMVASLSPKGSIEDKTPIQGKVNSKHNEGVICLFENDKKMLLFKTDGSGDFYISERLGDYWSKEKPLKGINSPYAESHATFSQDGKTIIFSSNRNSKKGKFNLFISKKVNNKWSKPKEISGINTSYYDDDFPFLSKDGTKLYFSSKRKGGLGGYDVYVSKLDKTNKRWGKPTNLGKPVNSPQDDLFFAFDESIGKGYLTSTRPGGYGESDIYSIKLNNEIMLRGYVFHDFDSLESENSNLYLSFTANETNHEYICKVDLGGYYQLPMNTGEAYTCNIMVKLKDNNYKTLKTEVVKLSSGENRATIIQDFYLESNITSARVRYAQDK